MARRDVSQRFARAFFDLLGLSFVVAARASINPASINAEASGDTTQVATGAILGDFVLASWETDVLTGVNAQYAVYVSAADTVTHHFSNGNAAAGAAIDIAATNVNVVVLRRQR